MAANFIILVTPNYPPAICGVGDYSFHLKGQLKKAGHETRIVHKVPGGKWGIEEEPSFEVTKLITILNALSNRYPTGLIFWQYTPYNFSKSGMPFYLPWIMLRLHKRGWHHVVYFHEVSIRLWGHGFKKALLAISQRFIANTVSLISASTFTNIFFYRQYFIGKKPIVVPVGANILPVQFTLNPSKKFDILCFANRANEALFVALAELNKKQQVCLLLAGFLSQAQKRFINLMLNKYELHQRVFITGAIDLAELSACFNKSRIYFQPQLVEQNNEGGISTKSGAVMAAMAHGLAIVTTRGDMTDESIFIDGDNVAFVDYHDSRDYAKQLGNLLQDERALFQMGESAIKTYRQKFDWAVIGTAILNSLKLNIT